MKSLVVGASGATGKLLVGQLLDRGVSVRTVVRSPDRLPREMIDHPNLTVVQGSILDFTDADLANMVRDCDTIASCLGHNLSFKGVFGPPYRLVTRAAARLGSAAKAARPGQVTKFVLMSSTGVENRGLHEHVPLSQKLVIAALRLLLPPHTDNEKAAALLRTKFDQTDDTIEWAAVRPDSLVDEDQVSEYTVHPSPIRNPIFDAGRTSRMNVANFMAELIIDDDCWATWKGRMPVIYNGQRQDG